MTWEVRNADCIEAMAEMDEGSIDAIVTDPPYGLGFMGRKWDALPPGPEFAEQAFRVLKPGGHLLAFGGTRTVHRLAVAIEDAGFEIRDQIAWMYGSGFPKSHNLKGEREGWGTALKPAHEPIVVARKPLTGTVAANVVEFGTGALNVDGCRVGFSDNEPYDIDKVCRPNSRGEQRKPSVVDYTANRADVNVSPSGRWPANVVLDPEAGAMLDEQSGERPVSGTASSGKTHRAGAAFFGGCEPGIESRLPADSGGASRFFYCAKASKRERGEGNVHPTVKPIALMRWLVRLVTPPGGTVLDPFTGSGTTGCAAVLEGFDFIGCEAEEEYVEIARARIAHYASEPVVTELFAA